MSSGTQGIKKTLLPAIKGFPIIAACFIIALTIASRALYYATPKYEATALLKLDEKNNGPADNNLYKNFDVFTVNNKIITEEQVIQSPLIIDRALDLVDFNVSYYRKGKIRRSEMYHASPFKVKALINDSTFYNKNVSLTIINKQQFVIQFSHGGNNYNKRLNFGQAITGKFGSINVSLNQDAIAINDDLKIADEYEFVVHSKDFLIEKVIGKNLDVKALDKEIPIVRISYACEVPEKTAAFANAVAQAYIDDYTENKSEVASKTVQFIDDRLNDIGEKLKQSEIALETYRTENNIINTTQETDAGIKELSQLKIQLAGLDMKEASLDNLYSYVISKRNFEEVAPNFEAFGDPLFTEMMKGLKQYTQERRELLNKYTPEHEKILLIDAKINDNIKYIKESIRNAKNDIAIKRSELFSAYDEANHRFDSLPSQEKDMVVLEREFQLNQKVYQFLVEKRTEASIAQAATISFHRIIKLAEIPVGPISPKPTMMRIIAGFLGLMIGLAIVYTRRAMRGKIEDKETVEKHSTLPIAGIIKQNTSAAEAREENFYTLSTNLILLNQIKRGTAITITSTIEKEGKTYAAINLAWALSQMGWKVLLCDMNSKQSAFDSYFDSLPANGMVNHIVSHEPIFNCCTEVNRDLFVAPIGTMYTSSSHMFSHQQLGEKIASLKRNFDIVIFDAAATSYTIDAVALMKHADLNLYIVRANLTPQHMVQHADMLKEEYQLSNLMLLINGMHQATNYSGHFTGSLYGYHKQAQNWRLRIKHYVQSYYKRAA